MVQGPEGIRRFPSSRDDRLLTGACQRGHSPIPVASSFSIFPPMSKLSKLSRDISHSIRTKVDMLK